MPGVSQNEALTFPFRELETCALMQMATQSECSNKSQTQKPAHLGGGRAGCEQQRSNKALAQRSLRLDQNEWKEEETTEEEMRRKYTTATLRATTVHDSSQNPPE